MILLLTECAATSASFGGAVKSNLVINANSTTPNLTGFVPTRVGAYHCFLNGIFLAIADGLWNLRIGA